MTLARDLSDLPRAETAAPAGVAPDAHPRFVGVLAAAWDASRGDDKPTALGTRVRHSDAGKCARALAYTAAGIPRSDPMDLCGVWNTSLGTLIHDRWQEALVAAWPTAEIEVKVGHDDLDASGHIDAVITLPCADCEGAGEVGGQACPGCLGDSTDRVIAYELKTIGGYGYKAAVGRARRGTPAEGPKPEHVAQAALNGLAVGADEVIVGYLAKECISVNQARGLDDLARFAAEWTFTRDEYEPIAIAERDRMAGVLALVDDGMLAARKFPAGMLPAGAEIVDPASGRWEVTGPDGVEDTGTWWSCSYCAHRTLCATTAPGRIPIESVTAAEGVA